jgi:hypothetical protein
LLREEARRIILKTLLIERDLQQTSTVADGLSPKSQPIDPWLAPHSSQMACNRAGDYLVSRLRMSE